MYVKSINMRSLPTTQHPTQSCDFPGFTTNISPVLTHPSASMPAAWQQLGIHMSSGSELLNDSFGASVTSTATQGLREQDSYSHSHSSAAGGRQRGDGESWAGSTRYVDGGLQPLDLNSVVRFGRRFKAVMEQYPTQQRYSQRHREVSLSKISTHLALGNYYRTCM